MSDKSDEELVGDVDFDFDPLEDAKTVIVTQPKREKEKPTAPSKKVIKKKSAIKAIPFQNDLLQAFAMGATSVQTMSKSSNVKKKDSVGVKGKTVSDKIVKQNSRGEVKKIKDKVEDVPPKDKKEETTKTTNKAVESTVKQKIHSDELETVPKSTGNSKTDSDERMRVKNIKEELVTPDKSSKTLTKTIIKQKVHCDEIKTFPESTSGNSKTESDKMIHDKNIKEELVTPDKSSKTLTKTIIKQKVHCDEIKTFPESTSGNSKTESDNRIHEKNIKEKLVTPDKSSKTSVTQERRKESSTSKNEGDINVSDIPDEEIKGLESSIAKVMDDLDHSTTQAIKRKADDAKDEKYPAKLHKTDLSEVQAKTNQKANKDTDIAKIMDDFSMTDLSEAQTKSSQNVNKGADSTSILFTEEDYKSMDNYLADEMLSKSREKMTSRSGAKYVVQVSPLEIADLAHPSVQQLIQLHPTMSLIFKRQTVKFRKKKGFAEATFSTMTELKEFVYKLTQIKVLEKRIDVTIKALNQADILSFVIHLNRNGKLLDLLGTGEDPLINKPIPIGENTYKIQFEKVPRSANAAFMHSMFPFTNNVLVSRTSVGKDSKTVYQGPVSVFYVNSKWLESVMDCCSDFTVNGFPLTVIGDNRPDQISKRIDSVEKRTIGEPDQRLELSLDCDDDNDDAVSNMTRDVCADMLESIQKLRELEPNSSNMKKFLEMENQMNALQSSLGKSRRSSSNEPEREGPKQTKLTPAEKRQREMKYLEERLDEAANTERLKEEQRRQQRELELQKKKEFDQKKKSQWVKNILSDFKKEEGMVGERISADAEKILRQREQRIQEKEEEEKQRKAEEIRKREEEEKLRLQREQEEKYKEAERKRLIEKIEETRLRDSKKFSSSQLLWNPSSSKAVSRDSPSPSKHGSAESAKGSVRNRDGDQRYKNKRESAIRPNDGDVDMIDDGVDERLADFARELAQLGKIDHGALASSTSSRSADRQYSSNRDEFDEGRILSEKEYKCLAANDQLHTIPEGSLKVQVASYPNRLCPVHGCPSKTNFRDMVSFMDHWVIFHQAQTAMKFCPRCSAYFMNQDELENHIMKHHWLSSKEANELMRNARVKVIPNPSYRDPYPFIRPLSPS